MHLITLKVSSNLYKALGNNGSFEYKQLRSLLVECRRVVSQISNIPEEQILVSVESFLDVLSTTTNERIILLLSYDTSATQSQIAGYRDLLRDLKKRFSMNLDGGWTKVSLIGLLQLGQVEAI